MRSQRMILQLSLATFFLFLFLIFRDYFDRYRESAFCNAFGPFGVEFFSFQYDFFIRGGIIIFFAVQWWREEQEMKSWLWVCILTGGIANCLEKWIFGCVVDYITIFSFPAFNGADVLLTIGATGIVWQWIRERNIL
ncbi:MAG: signal peptidase II [Candidatus Moranbacteria bacterium]|nr:signal peptidase II [Candidatus Moranbacteria bacterium]